MDGATPGQVAIGGRRKQVVGFRPAGSVPLWHPLQVPALLEFLP